MWIPSIHVGLQDRVISMQGTEMPKVMMWPQKGTKSTQIQSYT